MCVTNKIKDGFNAFFFICRSFIQFVTHLEGLMPFFLFVAHLSNLSLIYPICHSFLLYPKRVNCDIQSYINNHNIDTYSTRIGGNCVHWMVRVECIIYTILL
jgi:hypothetical protein